MPNLGARALLTVGVSVLFALSAACGGSHPEAKSPEVEVAETSGVGSITPVPESAGDTPDAPAKPSASSADDGSDIIPPFSTGKTPAAKKSRPARGHKKTSSSAKKKRKRKGS